MRSVRLRRMFVLLGIAVLALGSVNCAKEPKTPEAYVGKRVGDLKELVAKEVKDPDRAQEVTAAFDRVHQGFEAQAKVVAQLKKELRDAARRYDASDEEIEAIFVGLKAEGLKLVDVFEEGHYEVRELVTEEEWTAIVDHEHKILGIF